MYHIAAELTLFGGLFYYVNTKHKNLISKLYDLEEEIEEINEALNSIQIIPVTRKNQERTRRN